MSRIFTGHLNTELFLEYIKYKAECAKWGHEVLPYWKFRVIVQMRYLRSVTIRKIGL